MLSFFTRSHALIVTASVLWALMYVVRTVLVHHVNILVLTSVSLGLGALFLACWVRPSPRRLGAFLRRYPWHVPLMSVAMMTGSVSMMLALTHLGVGVATVLGRIETLAVLVLAVIFLGEKLSLKALPWGALALGAACWVASPHPLTIDWAGSDGLGLLGISATILCYGISSIMGRFLISSSGIAAPDLAFLRCSMGSLAALPLLVFVPTGELVVHLTPLHWGMLIVSSTFCLGLATIFYYKGLRNVDAPTASFLEMTTPAFCVVLGCLFLGEHLAPTQWIAMPILLGAVLQIVRVGANQRRLKKLAKESLIVNV